MTAVERFGLACLLATVTPALAQTPTPATLSRGEKVLMAYCMVDQGCVGHLTDLTIDEMQLLMPGTHALKESKDPILVFPRNKAGEWTYYVDSRRTLIELHTYFGGVGQPETRLFSPELPGEIQPRNGHWRVASDPAIVKDCMPGVAKALAGRTQLMKEGPVQFKQPFHGRQLLDSPRIQWVKTAPNRYVATLQSAGEQMMYFRYEVEVKSASRIDGQARVILNIPSQKTCTITTPFRYTRDGG